MAEAIDVQRIYSHPELAAFLAERNKGVPRIKNHPLQLPWNRHPGVMAGRIVAEEREDRLWLGVILSDDSEFWREWQGSFGALLLSEVEKGWTVRGNATREWFGQWLAENSPQGIHHLSYYDSGLGACWIDATGISGITVTIDER